MVEVAEPDGTTVAKPADEAQRAEKRARSIIDSFPQKIFTKDRNSTYLQCNKALAEGLGMQPEEIVGKNDFDLFPKELAEKYRADDQRVIESGESVNLTERYVERGTEILVHTVKVPLRDANDAIIGVLGMLWDITEQTKAEEARRRAEEIIRRQAQEILDISTPVMQVWDGIVAMPLIGTLDSQRTQRATEQLLQRIVDTRSSVALLDITGVPAIDTQTARHLIETISAVRLLGAQVILTGIRPAIAQTLVHLGIDLSGVTTRSSLAGGLAVALDALNLRVVRKNGGD